MNRTDRLYGLVEELRARAPRPMRAAELARRFEVSTRTIERDLLALQEAGVPIWAQPGPGGGYGLDANVTLPPLNLTPAEAAAIATALAATRSMPFSEAGRSALAKVTGAMATASRDAASLLTSQIRVAQGPTVPDESISYSHLYKPLRKSIIMNSRVDTGTAVKQNRTERAPSRDTLTNDLPLTEHEEG